MSTSDDTPTKICKQCGQSFPATEEYFYAAKGWKGKGLYLRGKCKECYCDDTKAAHAKRFTDDPDRIRKQRRKWHNEHPEASTVYHKKYYVNNHEKEMERARKYKTDHPEKARLYQKKAARKWHVNNMSKVKAKKARRRARLAAASGTHTAADIERQITAQTGKDGKLRCWWCGGVIEDQYHVDHRIPLVKGGSNDAGNLCITHPKCNLSKNDKMPWEFNGRLI